MNDPFTSPDALKESFTTTRPHPGEPDPNVANDPYETTNVPNESFTAAGAEAQLRTCAATEPPRDVMNDPFTSPDAVKGRS